MLRQGLLQLVKQPLCVNALLSRQGVANQGNQLPLSLRRC